MKNERNETNIVSILTLILTIPINTFLLVMLSYFRERSYQAGSISDSDLFINSLTLSVLTLLGFILSNLLAIIIYEKYVKIKEEEEIYKRKKE